MGKTWGATLLAATMASTAWAGGGGRWIHVRVDDPGDRDSRVDLQLPLAMVSAMMPALQGHVRDADDLRFTRGRNADEIRLAWQAVKGARDGEYVTVHDRDDDVRVAKRDGVLRIEVDGRGSRRSRVRVRIPVPLVDSLLGAGDAVDLDAVARALDALPDGEIVTVDDDDSRVRIWIDARAAAATEATR